MNWKMCVPHIKLFSGNFEGAKLTSNDDVADPVVKMGLVKCDGEPENEFYLRR